jgi:hypothetical protein
MRINYAIGSPKGIKMGNVVTIKTKLKDSTVRQRAVLKKPDFDPKTDEVLLNGEIVEATNLDRATVPWDIIQVRIVCNGKTVVLR